MRNRFDMGGSLDSFLPSVMPIVHRFFRETCFRIVMCQQFWLCLGGLWELFLQYLGNSLVIVLPRTLQQGLRGCVLTECVLEHIGCLRWHTTLIDNLRLD